MRERKREGASVSLLLQTSKGRERERPKSKEEEKKEFPLVFHTYMRICDRVHGEIQLCGYLTDLVSHPLFHRLDAVRQLGGCAFLYPSTTHTRKEHSLGVCHLAALVGRSLKQRHPHLVDEDDILCLQVAGLAHDLGHGPFSHTFEDYMHQYVPEWSHEDMACALLRIVFEDVTPKHQPFRRGTMEQHLCTIETMIRGVTTDLIPTREQHGRGPEKRFLFEIVHNHINGIDVDKWDYLCRDSLAAFGAVRPLSLDRLVRSVRLWESAPSTFSIAFDEAVAFEMVEMYTLRARLHRQVYQHHGVLLVESLLVELMNAIDRVSVTPFHVVANNVTTFGSMVDASILSHPLIHHPDVLPIHKKLLKWTDIAKTRSPTLVVRTLPTCRHCCDGAHETELRDAYCSQCGASTYDRTGIPSCPEDDASPHIAPTCGWTEQDISKVLCERTGRRDVVVCIRDIKCGSKVTVKDPHGRHWCEYDPLRKVVFTHKDTPTRVSSVALHAPQARHVRSVRCYVTTTNPLPKDEELRAVHEEFVSWGREIGTLLERHVAEDLLEG